MRERRAELRMPADDYFRGRTIMITIPVGITTFRMEGPYDLAGSVLGRAGVYVILCLKDKQYVPIDVGQAESVRERLAAHDRQACWYRNCASRPVVAVKYIIDPTTRDITERTIRKYYDLPCGEK